MPMVRLPCYCATLRQAARALTTMYDERIRPSGIRTTQFGILQALTLQPGARITDMVEWLALDQTTLTRNLALLRKRGLVEVTERPSGREKCWDLTRSGKAKFAQVRALWDEAQAEVDRRLGTSRAQAVRKQVYELAASFAP